MLNYLKSFLVFLGIALVLCGLFFDIRSFFKPKKTHGAKRVFSAAGRIIAILVLVALLLPCATFYSYIIPWDHNVPIQRVAEITVSDENSPHWVSIYEHYEYDVRLVFLAWLLGDAKEGAGWMSSEWSLTSEELKAEYGIEVDFDKYTYLVVYGSEAEKLTWNVWDTYDPMILFGIGRKWGKLTYKDGFDPHKIYLYRFPYESIENHDFVSWVD